MRNAELEEVLKGLADAGETSVPLRYQRFSRVRISLYGYESELVASVKSKGARRTASELTKAGLPISRDTVRRLCKEVEEYGHIRLPPHFKPLVEAPPPGEQEIEEPASLEKKELTKVATTDNIDSESQEVDANKGCFKSTKIDGHSRNVGEGGKEKMTPERQREIVARKLKEQRGEL